LCISYLYYIICYRKFIKKESNWFITRYPHETYQHIELYYIVIHIILFTIIQLIYSDEFIHKLNYSEYFHFLFIILICFCSTLYNIHFDVFVFFSKFQILYNEFLRNDDLCPTIIINDSRFNYIHKLFYLYKNVNTKIKNHVVEKKYFSSTSPISFCCFRFVN
jgi:hypothetical protein